MPVVKGIKSPTERFAGADDTFTIEALMQVRNHPKLRMPLPPLTRAPDALPSQNGWALQSGTSHFLGQNFARAFDVSFQDESNAQQLVWATSWGVSTRLVGALIMSHSDDAGLVLPPNVAPIQAVVIPISQGPDKAPDEHAVLMGFVAQAVRQMESAGVRVHVDQRFNLRPGPKFFEWERKGIPLRLEVGPRDVAQGKFVAARRTGGDKFELGAGDGLGAAVAAELAAMQAALLAAAEERLRRGTTQVRIARRLKNHLLSPPDAPVLRHSPFDPPLPQVNSYAEMKAALEEAEGPGTPGAGFFLVPWRDDAEAEKAIKVSSRLGSRMLAIPQG